MELMLFIICFALVYLVYYIVVISKKNKLDKLVKSTECMYLEKRYHVNVRKIPIKKLANHLALTNALIMATTVLIISVIDSWLLKFLCGIVVLIVLIIVCYHILGSSYQKRQKEELK